MHLIWQTHAITNSSQISLEFTFQPSSEFSSVFDLIQKEQEQDEEEKYLDKIGTF